MKEEKATKEKIEETKSTDKKEMKEEKATKPEEKKEKKKEVVVKKTEAILDVKSVPISTKHSVAICNVIKGKKIDVAISEIEEVIKKKIAVPMKGEIPHRKGKRMMSGRFVTKAAKEFLNLLKSVKGNANHNNLENPMISEAIANKASRPVGRFGRVRRKRTHIFIKLIEKQNKTNKKEKKK